MKSKNWQSKRFVRRWFSTFLIVVSILVAGSAIVLTASDESQWIGHAVVGIFSFAYAIAAVVTGVVLSGRVFAFYQHGVDTLHRKVSIWCGIFVVGAYLYGLIVHGEPLLESLHGQFGTLVAVLGFLQVAISLSTTKRDRIHLIHRIIGYTIPPLLVLQIMLGLVLANIVEIL